MGKILQILIIENRDLAHAQTFCTRVGEDSHSTELTVTGEEGYSTILLAHNNFRF